MNKPIKILICVALVLKITYTAYLIFSAAKMYAAERDFAKSAKNLKWEENYDKT